MLIAFIVVTLGYSENIEGVFNSIMDRMNRNIGWFFIFTVNVMILSALYFAFGKFGNIKIGGKKAQPEFSKFAWYAMLLSAGMGIGLLFWSVGEPISHLQNPSPMFGQVALGSAQAAQAAMATTFFHWGIYPWAIYAMVGLGLAFLPIIVACH